MNIVGRYFASMLGGVVARDYNDGLAELKELAESLPGADFSDIEIEHIVVEARLKERDGRWLTFNAEIRDQAGQLLARAQALHWIIDLVDEHS